MDVQIILFVYGIAMIMLFSMLSLQTYKDWVSKKGQLIDFILFALIDVITIIAFILQFKN